MSGLAVADCCVIGSIDRCACSVTKSATLPGVTVASKRSGDRDPLLEAGVVLGGDAGELIVTDGVSCGVERRSIDIGRLCPFLGGDPERWKGKPGLRGVSGLSALLVPGELHSDCGLGRSSEILPTVVFWRLLGLKKWDGVSFGDGNDSPEGLACLRASKCERREETGFSRIC